MTVIRQPYPQAYYAQQESQQQQQLQTVIRQPYPQAYYAQQQAQQQQPIIQLGGGFIPLTPMPKVVSETHWTRQVYGPQPPIWTAPDVKYHYMRDPQWLQEQKSRSFYTSIGYPQYSGVYEPFTIPTGYKVKEIKETERGLEISLTSTIEEPKGLAERMMEFKMVPIFQQLGWPASLKPGQIPGRTYETRPLAPIAGFVATFENLVYFIPKLAGVKGLPRSPPTLTGGLVGKAVQGGAGLLGFNVPSTELEVGFSYGPEYMVGSFIGDIAASALISKGVGEVWQRIRGVKVTRVSGASEIERVTATESTAESERLTRLGLTKEYVPYDEARYLRQMQRFYVPEQIELGGMEKVVQAGGGEFDVYARAALGFREASPYVAAAKGQFGITFAELETATEAAERVMISGKGAVYQFTRVAGQSFIGPEEMLVERSFTAVQFLGRIDTQVYLNLIKAVPVEVAQRWFPQMGGVSTQILEKAMPASVTLFTKVVSIGGVGKVGSLVGAATLGISKISLTPTLKEITRTMRKISVTPYFVAEQKQKPVLVPSPILSQLPRERDIVTPRVLEVPTTKPVFKLPTMTMPTPKFDVPTKTVPTLKIPTPTLPTPTTPKSAFPYWPRGGGEGKLGHVGALSGRWFKRIHPIKTPKQMLETFGIKGGFKIPKQKTRTKAKKRRKQKR